VEGADVITTTEAAQQLGLARRTVQKWCAVLGYRKQGRDYLLTEEELVQIRALAQRQPGRPRVKKLEKFAC